MGGLVFSSGICNGHFGTLIWTRVRRGNHYLCLNQAVFLKGRNLHPNLVVIMVNPCTFFLLCNWCSIIIIVAGATTIIWRSKLSQLKNKDMLPWYVALKKHWVLQLCAMLRDKLYFKMGFVHFENRLHFTNKQEWAEKHQNLTSHKTLTSYNIW